jgi:hypothetical protein
MFVVAHRVWGILFAGLPRVMRGTHVALRVDVQELVGSTRFLDDHNTPPLR